MKLSYYPGCSLRGTAFDYDSSVKEVCSALGIELVEIPDWNCCGASSAHMTGHEVGIRLPLRNLLLAAELGNDILVPCSACFQRLKAAQNALNNNREYWDLHQALNDCRIIHISTLLARADQLHKITGKARISFDGLRVACYYGCLSLRNPKTTDVINFEQPTSLEQQMKAVGATPVSWSHRTECCSGSLTMARPDIAKKLVGDIISAAENAGAEALVTDCPMCQANLESRQLDLDRRRNLPVYFATEIIQAAFAGNYPSEQQKGHLVAPDRLTWAVTMAPATGRETV